MRHDAVAHPQIAEADVAEVDVVDRDAAVLRIVEPQQELQQRGFAAAVRADDGDRFAGLDVEAHAVEHLLLRLVGEVDVFERERARELGQRTGMNRVDDLWLTIDDFVDAIGRGDALLQLVEFL